jgi:hypothetical protein
MARDRHREHALFPRALRARAIARASILGTALAVPSRAVAEVCDKVVGESWSPQHGPVWLLHPVGFPLGLTAIVSGLIIAALLRRAWLAYLGAVQLAIYGGIAVFADLIPQPEVYRSALKEGCRSVSTDIAEVALVALFALAYVWVGRRTRRRAPIAAGAHS